MDFCKKFNEATKEEESGVIIPVVIFVYMDRSFDFILKQPPASELIKKAAGIKSGSATSKVTKAGTISIEQVRKIAIRKLPDLNTYKLEAAMEIIKGTAKNMGVEVIKE
jgi:large subunit ribosomal protein L11